MTESSCAGILLYYKYVDLTARQEEVQQWFLTLCGELKLKGRIRVARDGINCTVRFCQQSCMLHYLDLHKLRLRDLMPNSVAGGRDYQLAPCPY